MKITDMIREEQAVADFAQMVRDEQAAVRAHLNRIDAIREEQAASETHSDRRDMILKIQSLAKQLLAELEQQHTVCTVEVPQVSIRLRAGEFYAGLMCHQDGTPHYHLILMPETLAMVNWHAAGAWAATMGGSLPRTSEQAVLLGNIRTQVKYGHYWSCEANDALGEYAYAVASSNSGRYTCSMDDNSKSAMLVRRVLLSGDAAPF